ncbi:hypothetical protein C2G38_2059026 [Gigaspora rosea]|uniref:Homing endonuclease LAGLIDADG domain-containing protein n=1 Tax=Gigaspora rosea TaxID=44941 RepID=A0A397W4Q8_9GLOM|nr:hypothetical protein C2G38_2059026 [Gigaspora rosea]
MAGMCIVYGVLCIFFFMAQPGKMSSRVLITDREERSTIKSWLATMRFRFSIRFYYTVDGTRINAQKVSHLCCF